MFARERWTELDIGPFTVDTTSDESAARHDLNQVEQLRWVMEGLLEIQDLRARWPIRIVLKRNAPPSTFAEVNGEYVLLLDPETPVPLEQVARLFLDANTPRMAPGTEDGLLKLLASIHADGSRVTWGGPVPNPDLNWARMQLFATKFEYRASLHVLVASLRSGSSLNVAERNAFGRDPAALEKEAQENLQQGNWTAVPVSGRPLDPKRDLGVHGVSTELVSTYLADALQTTDLAQAETLYKEALSDAQAKPRADSGLAEIAIARHSDPTTFLQQAIAAGPVSAQVYVELARVSHLPEAREDLHRAEKLNPRWAVPFYEESKLADNDAEREDLLKKAVAVNPRQTSYWVELAKVQSADGHALQARSSWLRAEDSAETPDERSKIEQMASSAEEQRLNAAEQERNRERDAARLDDQKAQDAENARIRAAEEKANRELDAASGDKPDNVVAWDAMATRTLNGKITRVDCLKKSRRITVQDKAGKSLALRADGQLASQLTCGAQAAPRQVVISYASEPDETLQTDGRVLSLKLQ